MKADGTQIVRLAEEESDYPRWSPDGKWISYVTPDATWLMRPDGSGKRKLTAQIDWPDWSADGKALVGVQVDEKTRKIVRHDIASGKTTEIVDLDTFTHLKDARVAKLAIPPDQRRTFVMTDRFDGGYTATNGRFRPTGAWAVAALDLKSGDSLFFVGDGCQPALDPSGEFLYHARGDIGAIAQMRADDRSRKSHRAFTTVDKEVAWAYCPAVSTDGKWLSYVGASRHESWGTGDYDVYLQPIDRPEALRLRLAQHPANDRWPHLYVGPLQTEKAAPASPPTLPTSRPSQIRLIAEVVGVSKIPSPFNIRPYRECLMLAKYRVIEVASGMLADRDIFIVHWGIRDLKPTPESAFKSGQRHRLTCEPFADQNRLQRYPMANDMPDSAEKEWWMCVKWDNLNNK